MVMWSLCLFVVVIDDSLRYGTMLKLLHHRTFIHPRIKISIAGFSSREEKIGTPLNLKKFNSGLGIGILLFGEALGYCFRAIPTSKSFVMVIV